MVKHNNAQNEKATHTFKRAGYPETAVRLMNMGWYDRNGIRYYTVIPGVKSKLYQDGHHVIANVSEYKLTPITSRPRRELQESARQYVAAVIQGCLEAGSITSYCDRNGLTDLDNEYLTKELKKIIGAFSEE